VRAVTQTWDAVQTTPLWGKVQEYSQTTYRRLSEIKLKTISAAQTTPGMTAEDSEVSEEVTATEEETALELDEPTPTQT
jgi:hypothetical protein